MSEMPVSAAPSLLDRLGRSEGYIAGTLALSLLATVLLLLGRIGESSWQVLVLGAWAAVCGGGAVSAYRE